MTTRILRIDSSARRDGSGVARPRPLHCRAVSPPPARVVVTPSRPPSPRRFPPSPKSGSGANFTPADSRDDAQRGSFLRSPTASVAELEAADVLVIGLPIYNFLGPREPQALDRPRGPRRSDLPLHRIRAEGPSRRQAAPSSPSPRAARRSARLRLRHRLTCAHILGFIGISGRRLREGRPPDDRREASLKAAATEGRDPRPRRLTRPNRQLRGSPMSKAVSFLAPSRENPADARLRRAGGAKLRRRRPLWSRSSTPSARASGSAMSTGGIEVIGAALLWVRGLALHRRGPAGGHDDERGHRPISRSSAPPSSRPSCRGYWPLMPAGRRDHGSTG